MHCEHCGIENNETNLFCEACGATLGVTCDSCGHINRRKSRFCGQCRAALTSSLGLSADVLGSLRATGGERKRVTVLFADIRNSTNLIDQVGDPELGLRRLQPVLDLMKDAVHRYDGIVNKMQGDGVMAIFGAPRPHEDHAVRGCLTALAMQDAVARLDDSSLQIRVGLHTGQVVVQAVSNSLSQTYDAAGANVHLANRMEQMADGAAILVTGETYAAALQFVNAEPLGPQVIRGIAAPVEVFKLTGLRHAPASERFRSGPRPIPLRGRTHELEALERELATIMQNEARVVGVVGEAGVGKSRLCFEFAETCRRRGIRVLEARVLAHGQATPLQLVLDLLRDAFGIQPKEAADVSRQRIKDALNTRGDFAQILPILQDFLGVADPDHPISKDPVGRKRQLLDFIQQYIRARRHDEAAVLVVEDLHWVDAASADFIDAMVDAIVGTKTLLLVNFRPGLVAPWTQRSHYRQINLAPLENIEASLVLRDLLGDDASIALLSRNLTERAQGNVFFLEELVRSLAERGDFEGDRGAYRLKSGIDAIPLPTSIQAVLSARIDRLAELPRQMLQTAAVIGREISLPILQLVTNLSSTEFALALTELRRAELLYEPPPFEQKLLAFRHLLIQEVAYESLLHGRRRELHAAVAGAMESYFRDQIEERASLLAYHLERAGNLLAAAQANARAAFWVGARDSGQALRSWRKVRELVVTQPRTQAADYLRMMACAQIVNFGWREGITANEAEPYFKEASSIAQAVGNMRANALIHAGYGRILAATGSADEYVAKIREAQDLAGNTADPSLQVTLNAVLCHALRLSGRISEALVANIEAMSHAHEMGQFDRQMLGFDIEPWLTAMRGQILVILGQNDEARPYLDQVLQMNANEVSVTDHVAPSVAYVDLAWSEADVRLAEQHSERAFSMAIRSGNPYVRVYAQACRGLAHITAGHLDAAVEDLVAALDFGRRHKAGLENEARILADLANAHCLRGDYDCAIQSATEAIDVAIARCYRMPECLARIVRAEALWLSSSVSKQPEEDLMRADMLIEENGGFIYRPLIREVNSKLGNKSIALQPETPLLSGTRRQS
jgi:class 3 adenylate cyclase/tetratricopeptide (TPR) repeat protein